MLLIHVENLTNNIIVLPVIGNLIPWGVIDTEISQRESKNLLFVLQTLKTKDKVVYTVTNLDPHGDGIPSIPLSPGDKKVVNIFTDVDGKLRVEYNIS
jgi:hypothetical protein